LRFVICNLNCTWFGRARFTNYRLQITNYKLQMAQLLLAVDTSGKNGSLGLARTGPGRSVEIVEVVPLTGGAFSAQLVPEIAALLRKHGYSKSDLGAFAVASGPGSFTGLRVGLAAIKALAEGLQKPIVAISLLEAVARSGSERGRVLAVLDAERGDYYAGDYEIVAQDRGQLHSDVAVQLHMHSERLLSGKELIAEAGLRAGQINGAKIEAVVTPDVALEEKVGTSLRALGLRVERVEYPNSAVIARLGWERLQRGQTVRPEELEANYIRQSDAEIFSKPGR
jgi:tRNA threonylcarbamoyladenosine biosynthesis protein TsaB